MLATRPTAPRATPSFYGRDPLSHATHSEQAAEPWGRSPALERSTASTDKWAPDMRAAGVAAAAAAAAAASTPTTLIDLHPFHGRGHGLAKPGQRDF